MIALKKIARFKLNCRQNLNKISQSEQVQATHMPYFGDCPQLASELIASSSDDNDNTAGSDALESRWARRKQYA